MNALSYTTCSCFCCRINSNLYYLAIIYQNFFPLWGAVAEEFLHKCLQFLEDPTHNFGKRKILQLKLQETQPERPWVYADSVQKLFLSKSDDFWGVREKKAFSSSKVFMSTLFFLKRSYCKRILHHCNIFVLFYISKGIPIILVPFSLSCSSSDPRLLRQGWNMALRCLGFMN